MREKFLFEHTHSEDEVRFFVKGQGLFCLHIGTKIYQVLCQKGDLISVPTLTPHWFDMGSDPEFTAIRLFNNTEGWVAKSTALELSFAFFVSFANEKAVCPSLLIINIKTCIIIVNNVFTLLLNK